MEDTRLVQVRDDTCIRMVGKGWRKIEWKIGKAWSLVGERKFRPSVSDQENKTQASKFHRRNLTGNYCTEGAFLVAQTVKNLPAMQETGVQSLGQEDPLEKRMGTHSSILAWRIPWTEEPGRLSSIGSQRVGLYLRDITYTCMHALTRKGRNNDYLLGICGHR